VTGRGGSLRHVALTQEVLLDHLTVDARAVAGLIPDVALSAPVPSCPGWTMVDLVGHLGSVHRWAAEVVRTREVAERPGAPVDPGALASWFAAGAEELLATLRATEPGQPCWGFGPPPRLVDFWPRRQALETAVHRWDAQGCAGQASAIAPDLAQDGVDEVVAVLHPRQVRLGRTEPLPAPLGLVAAETGMRWVLGADPARRDEVAATVTAPAQTLFLMLWRRVALESSSASVEGDDVVVRAAFSSALTP